VTDLIANEAIWALIQVVTIDLVLAGDNAVVIGLASAGLPHQERKRAIFIGILAATALRIAFAGIATRLLQIVGLLLAGGVLLLWVCWKMWRELRTDAHERVGQHEILTDYTPGPDRTLAAGYQRKTFGQATMQIVVADVSMSLDNILAVAGAAREHPVILVFGLLLSIALMGIAADLIGRLLQKRRWIAYVGLAVILYVAFEMIIRGVYQFTPIIGAAPPTPLPVRLALADL
jgi:YjbE family integral membrane protein